MARTRIWTMDSSISGQALAEKKAERKQHTIIEYIREGTPEIENVFSLRGEKKMGCPEHLKS